MKSDKEDAVLFPIIVLGHGLGGTSSNYLTKMRHWATHGFIVIAPETFNLFNGVDLLECLPWLAGENQNPSSFLFGAVDSNQVGLVGHSMVMSFLPKLFMFTRVITTNTPCLYSL